MPLFGRYGMVRGVSICPSKQYADIQRISSIFNDSKVFLHSNEDEYWKNAKFNTFGSP